MSSDKVTGFEAVNNFGGELIIPHGTTHIAPNAFQNRTTIVSVTMPNSIASYRDNTDFAAIGDNAFAGATGLETIIINGILQNSRADNNNIDPPMTLARRIPLINNTTFAGLTRGNVNVVVSSGTTVAFETRGWGGFTFVGDLPLIFERIGNTMNARVRMVPGSDFTGEMNIPSTAVVGGVTLTVTEIAPNGFQGFLGSVVTIPNTLTSIGNNAFLGTNVSIHFAESRTYIQAGLLQNQSGITNVYIPNTVTSVGDNAFLGANVAIHFVAGRTHIQAGLLENQSGVTNVRMHATVRNIGARAFANTGIAEFTVSHLWTYVGDDAFLGSDVILNYSIYASFFASRRNITHVNVASNVTSITANSFAGLTNLQIINMSPSVRVIESGAFRDTRIWQDAPYGEAIYIGHAFDNSKWLIGVRGIVRDIRVADGTVGIADFAFSGSGLESIYMPSSVRYIGAAVFYNTPVTCVYMPVSVQRIHAFMLHGSSVQTVVMHGGFRSYLRAPLIVMGLHSSTIGLQMFNLTAIYVPCYSTVTVFTTTFGSDILRVKQPIDVPPQNTPGVNPYMLITNGVLTGYTGTSSSIHIPNHVTHIADRAFYNNQNLRNVTFESNSGLTHIGFAAFGHNVNLQHFSMPQSVVYIAGWAFYNTPNLSVTWYYNPQLNAREFRYGLTRVVVLQGTTHIADWAFYRASGLRYIDILSQDLTIIGARAFQYTQISDIMLPDSVTHIRDRAFYRMNNLSRIVIPSSVEYVGAWNFYHTNINIFARSISRPVGWHSMWNMAYRPVVWGYVG